MAHRDEQLISFIKKEIANFLDREVARPQGSFFSVTNVVLAQSGQEARIFISIFPDGVAKEVFKTLKSYQKEARVYLAELLTRRKIPYIMFVHDTSQEDRIRLEKLLDDGSR